MSEEIIHLKKDSPVVGRYAKTTWRTPGKLKLPCAIHIDSYDERGKEFGITVLYDGRRLTMGLGQPLILISEEDAVQLANLRRNELAETEAALRNPGAAMAAAPSQAPQPAAPVKAPAKVAKPAAPKAEKKQTCYGFITEAVLSGLDKDVVFQQACGLFPDRDPKKIKSDVSVVRSDLKKKGKISY